MFSADDFLSGKPDSSIEARAGRLIEQGYSPSQAVAIASSSQTREQKLRVIDGGSKTKQTRRRA